MITEQLGTVDERCNTKGSSLCWTAIFAGALVGLGLGFLLNLFGVAIGLSAYHSNQNETLIAIGGVVGLLIGVIIAMGVSGFVAGYAGRFRHCYCHWGVIYGFVTWSLTLILSALLVIPTMHYMALYEESLNPALVATEISKASEAKTSTTKEQAASTALNQTVKHPASLGWVVFILFFVGAFSSCLGACWGMRCKKECSSNPPPHRVSLS